MTPTLSTSNYGQDLQQFHNQCHKDRDPVHNEAILRSFFGRNYKYNPNLFKVDCFGDIKINKVFYNRSEEACSVIVLKSMINILHDSCLEDSFSALNISTDVQMPKSGIVPLLQRAAINLKYSLIQNIAEGIFEKFKIQYDITPLNTWLTTKIVSIPNLSNTQVNVRKEIKNISSKFWNTCAREWAKKHNMDIIPLSPEIQTRWEELKEELTDIGSDFSRVPYIECKLYLILLLKLEEKWLEWIKRNMEDFSSRKALDPSLKAENVNFVKFYMDVLGYYQVEQPLAGDVIIYLDSDNNDVHMGIFDDKGQVISKIGENIYKHDPERCFFGNCYIILRKP